MEFIKDSGIDPGKVCLQFKRYHNYESTDNLILKN